LQLIIIIIIIIIIITTTTIIIIIIIIIIHAYMISILKCFNVNVVSLLVLHALTAVKQAGTKFLEVGRQVTVIPHRPNLLYDE